VCAGFGIRRGVHAHDFQIGVSTAADPTPQHIATNSAESIDGNAQGHGRNKAVLPRNGFGGKLYRIYLEIPLIDLTKISMK
jgi:hypothetical protein